MNEYSVVYAERENLYQIKEIERYAFYPAIYKPKRYYKRHIQFKRCFLCKQGDLIVGYLCFQPHKRFFVLTDLAIHFNFRHLGVATRLIKAFLSTISQDQNIEIRLKVDLENKNAILLYQKLGFVPYGKLPCYYGERSALLMKTTLPVHP